MKDSAPKDVDRLSRLLATYGTAQIAEVAGILHTQLEVINLLRQKVESGVLEKEVHKIIANNIWLLRPNLNYWFDNKAFSTVLGDRLAEAFKYEKGMRPDLACYDDHPLMDGESGGAKHLTVVEFKRPGVKIGSTELLQIMKYKKIFQSSLPEFLPGNIEVILLGDLFDESFDFDAFGEGYSVMSYQTLLANAHSRYGQLYASLGGKKTDSAEGGEASPAGPAEVE